MSDVEFAPDDTTTYGKCLECGLLLPTREEASAHMSETLAQSNKRVGHRVRLNPNTDEQRAKHLVARAIDDAVERFCEEIDIAVSRGDMTKKDAVEAMSDYPDFADAWQEWNE